MLANLNTLRGTSLAEILFRQVYYLVVAYSVLSEGFFGQILDSVYFSFDVMVPVSRLDVLHIRRQGTEEAVIERNFVPGVNIFPGIIEKGGWCIATIIFLSVLRESFKKLI